jgi:hypothetical protein
MTLKLYGASDDLIELDGDIDDEFYIGDGADEGGEGGCVGLSDGTVLGVIYDHDGVWRFTIKKNGTSEVQITGNDPDDKNNYSDTVTITGPIKWAMYSTELLNSK